MRIVVIGSGFGGLAAAIRLQAQGHDVTVVEALDRPGGRAYVFEQDGFTFDAGPTIITAPGMLEELFEIAGRRLADYVTLVPIDPFYSIRFHDGTWLHYGSDQDAVERQIAALSPDDVDGYRQFAAASERIFDTGMALIDQPFTQVRDMVRVLPDLARLRAYRSVASLVGSYVRDERLRQALSFHPLLIGGSPFRATSIYTLIHTLERRWGVWFAMGGTGALVRGLVRLLEDLGGRLELRSPVERIAVDRATNRATGVVCRGGRTFVADAVVSNADVVHTVDTLLPGFARGRRFRPPAAEMDHSMSLFVLYFGTDRRYDDVAHHEILLGPRYRGLLDDIFVHGRLAADFSLYLHRPTATDPSLAPAGCDAWYVLSPVPHLGGDTDWARAARPYRDAIVQWLERHRLPGLSRHIVTEHMVDPRYFRDVLRSHLGSAFSVEPTLTQSAWFRPHNRSEDVPNLYFAGAGTHPGAGIPGVLSSGKIVADLIGHAGLHLVPSTHRRGPVVRRTVGERSAAS